MIIPIDYLHQKIRDVAKGLAHLHGIPFAADKTRVMVHGDVKPVSLLDPHSLLL